MTYKNELAYSILNQSSASDGHTLIIPKRHVSDYFDLYQPELNAVTKYCTTKNDSLLNRMKQLQVSMLGSIREGMQVSSSRTLTFT